MENRYHLMVPVFHKKTLIQYIVSTHPIYPCLHIDPRNLIEKHLSEINFTERKSALKQNKKDTKDILPFVTQYEPAVPNMKQVLMKKWHTIEEQPLLKQILKDQPITSFKKGKSLKDMLFRAKI